MAIDRAVFRLSIFYFINFYWLLSCMERHISSYSFDVDCNAISSVIVVGAIVAALAGNSENIFNTSCTQLYSNNSSSYKYFWWIAVTQRMLQMYKKRKIKRNDFSKSSSDFI